MNELATTNIDAATIESVIIGGDLSKLTPAQRVSYYNSVCKSIGLNPLTKPFDYIVLNGKLQLYARKDATEQLRKIHGVSITKPEIVLQDDLIIVTVEGKDNTGRIDADVGVVKKSDMRGDVANAIMKAVTKAKRRLTLSICGLGWLDETEIETIPDAKPVVVTEQGEIIDAQADEVIPADLPEISYEAACDVTNAKGVRYGDIDTVTLSHMANSIMRAGYKGNETNSLKLSAIRTILAQRAIDDQHSAPAGV